MSYLLEVRNLNKLFPVGGKKVGFKLGKKAEQDKQFLHAVDDVSFAMTAGESIGLVGESGSGKSTLVRLIARLLDPTAGMIYFEGQDISLIRADNFALTPQRSKIQMVFQDPTDSLNPRFTAFDTITEPLRLLGGEKDSRKIKARVEELAEQVGLPQELLSRFPHQLSGGQKARVGIARAISINPKLLILDEPTSALDVSVQAIILHLLSDLQKKLGISYLFVSHDLNVIRLLCNRVLVLYLGKLIEVGPVSTLFNSPKHPYTQALISAIPDFGSNVATRIRITGEPRSPIDPSPDVCRFYGRCKYETERCKKEMPTLRQFETEHQAACHFSEKI